MADTEVTLVEEEQDKQNEQEQPQVTVVSEEPRDKELSTESNKELVEVVTEPQDEEKESSEEEIEKKEEQEEHEVAANEEEKEEKEDKSGSEAGSPKKRKKKEKKDKKESKDKKKKDKDSKKKKKKKKKDSDDESAKKKEELHHTIFGSSSDEEDDQKSKDRSDTYDADDVEAGGKSKMREVLEKKSKRTSKRKKATSTDADGNPVADDLDQAIEAIKSRSSRRKRIDLSDSTEAKLYVQDFISKMNIAAEEDIRANKANVPGQPALNKLMLLSEVQNQLNKKHLQTIFLDNDVLSTLKKWIDKLPDGSLPSVKVREVILSALVDFPKIEYDDLKRSDIGRAVGLLYKHPQETAGNKKLCKTLMDGWNRERYGLSDSYKTLTKDMLKEQYTVEQSTSRKSLTDAHLETSPKSKSSGSLSSPGQKKDSPTFHARIPDKIALDFEKRPESNAEALRNMATKGDSKSAYRSLFNTKKVGANKKAIDRAVKVSVEGRGVNL